MKKLLIFCVLARFATALHAQQPEPSPTPLLPPGPLLKPVPDFTKWTVTSQTKSAASAKDDAGKEDSVNLCTGQKTGNIIHIVNVMGNSGREEIWSNGKVMVVSNARWKNPMVVTGTPQELPLPDWISPKNFVSVQKIADKEYLIFRDRIFPGGTPITADMVGSGVDLESLKVDASASIDAATRLPAGVQIGGETTTYKFEELAQGVMQSFPAEVQEQITARSQAVESARRKPVRP